MTLQTQLFTGLLAAVKQQQQNSATFSLSLSIPLNKPLSAPRKRNLSWMRLFTESLGTFEGLLLFFPLHSVPLFHVVCVCQSVFAEIYGGTVRLMSQLLQDPSRNAFWQLQEQQDWAQRCCCNCTWLRHEKVIICCQGRQGVSVRQELIRYWLPLESSLTHSHSDSFIKLTPRERGRQERFGGRKKVMEEFERRAGVGGL